MEQIKIFVINLKRSPERRNEIIRQMNLYELKYEFFEAIDGKLLSTETIEKSRARSDHWYKVDEGQDATMKLGEIGVAMSHYKLYQKIIREDLDLAIIMEDDINFDKQFQQFLQNWKQVNSVMKNFDLILLGYCTHDVKFDQPAICSYWGRKRISKNYYIGIPVKWYWSAIAYVISKTGASLLTQKQGELPCVTADILTANSPQYGVKLGVLSKPIVWPGPLNNLSTIQLLDPTRNQIKRELKMEDHKKRDFKSLKRNLQNLKAILEKEKVKIKRRQYLFTTDRY